MINYRKASGVAAIAHALAYLVGIGLYVTLLNPILDAGPREYLALLPRYGTLMYWWIFICYMVAGFCLVPVAWAVHRTLSPDLPNLSPVIALLAFIWAALIIGSGNLMMYGFSEIQKIYADDPVQALAVVRTLHIVEDGIISANEFTGGLWAFLLCLAALRTGRLNRAVAYTGLVIGAAGILSVIPPLTEGAVTLFGVGMILWFILLGVHLIRTESAPRTAP